MNIAGEGGVVTVDLGAIIAVVGNVLLGLLYWSMSRNVTQIDKALEDARRSTMECRTMCRGDTDELARRMHDVELAHKETAKGTELQTLIQAVTRLQEQVSALTTQVEQLRSPKRRR